jgi:hypothetical protein
MEGRGVQSARVRFSGTHESFSDKLPDDVDHSREVIVVERTVASRREHKSAHARATVRDQARVFGEFQNHLPELNQVSVGFRDHGVSNEVVKIRVGS